MKLEDLKKAESIDSNIRHFQRGRHFGTKLDELDHKQMPPTYVGIEFSEMGHDQLRKFFTSTDREKFEMAYWAEKSWKKRGFVVGMIIGGIITFFIILILSLEI